MFKLLPQAKFKIVKENNPPPPAQTLIAKPSGKQTQTKILNFIEKKTEPKKFKVTGQQMQFNNPIQILDLEKGQNPLKKLA